MREVVREKWRGAICEITGSYLSFGLLGMGWRGLGNSSGGVRLIERG
jgi:hypothetical protein